MARRRSEFYVSLRTTTTPGPARGTRHTGMPCDATENDEEAAPLERGRSVACQTTLDRSKCRRCRSDDCYHRRSDSSSEDSYESDESVYNRNSAYTRRSRNSARVYCRRVTRNIRSRWVLFVRLTAELVIACILFGYMFDSFVQSHYGVGVSGIVSIVAGNKPSR